MATVELVSRSRRGIGKLELTFKTPYYGVDKVFPLPNGYKRLTGVVCALDKPFTLKVEAKVTVVPLEGKYMFTPEGTSGGSVKLTSQAGYGGKYVTPTSSGTYQVEGLAEGKPVLIMNPTTETTTGIDMIPTTTLPVPAWQLELEPSQV